MKKKMMRLLSFALLLLTLLTLTGCVATTENGESVAVDPQAIFGGLLGGRADSVQIILLLTVLSLLPSILIMLTGFTRISIVLSFVRSAMGLQQVPSNQVIIGLSLFLTFFVMFPVLTEIKEKAYDPYIKSEITQEQALDEAVKPLRSWMLRQTYTKELDAFAGFSGQEYNSYDDVPMHVIIPAFLTSEIRLAFTVGFVIYIPFIVIDMVVASTLMAMGMMMLPPVTISMPFKILLFVTVDGWTLLMQSLITGFK